MEKDYEITLNILKEQKNILIEKINIYNLIEEKEKKI